MKWPLHVHVNEHKLPVRNILVGDYLWWLLHAYSTYTCLAFDLFESSALSLFLTVQTVSSPNLIQTVQRTILHFLTDLLMRCKLQPKLCCTGCTQTCMHMLTYDTYSLSSICGRKPQQWTPWLCHALTYLFVFICWVPQITLTLLQVHKWGHFLRSERLKIFMPLAQCCCASFFSSSIGQLSGFKQSDARFVELNE